MTRRFFDDTTVGTAREALLIINTRQSTILTTVSLKLDNIVTIMTIKTTTVSLKLDGLITLTLHST
jgi:hypothetical protein